MCEYAIALYISPNRPQYFRRRNIDIDINIEKTSSFAGNPYQSAPITTPKRSIHCHHFLSLTTTYIVSGYTCKKKKRYVCLICHVRLVGTCVTSTGTWWLPKDERASERSRDKKALSVLLHPAKESKHARLSLQKLGGLGPLRKQLPSHHFPAPFQQSGKEIQPNSSPHQARGWEKYGQSLPPGGAFICLFSEVAVISNSPPFLVELLALASLPAGKARPPLFFFGALVFLFGLGRTILFSGEPALALY